MTEALLKLGICLLLITIVLPYIAIGLRLASYFVTDPLDVRQTITRAGPGAGANGGGGGTIVNNKQTLIYKFDHSQENLSDILTDAGKVYQWRIGLFDNAFTMMLENAVTGANVIRSVFDSFVNYLKNELHII